VSDNNGTLVLYWWERENEEGLVMVFTVATSCTTNPEQIENLQRRALQISFGNSPCNLSFGTLQMS